jgi:hypothetical protein
VLIIAATLIAAVAILGYAYGVFGIAASGPAPVRVTAQIYNAKANYGILNEPANFTVTITNASHTPLSGEVEILSSRHVDQRTPFNVIPGKNQSYFITQELNDTGVWHVEGIANGTVLSNSYNFQVAVDGQEADFQVNENGQVQQANNIALVAVVISAISAAAAIAAYMRPRSHEAQVTK